MSRYDPSSEWQERNRGFLSAAVDHLYARMQGEEPQEDLSELADAMAELPVLVTLQERFGLDAFERDLLLLCFAAEVDPRFTVDPAPITVGMALETIEGAHWSGIDEAGALRSWGLIEFERAGTFAGSALRLAPDVLRCLLGFDPRRSASFELQLAPQEPFVLHRHRELGAEVAAAIWATIERTGEAPRVELHGADDEDRLAVAGACAAVLRQELVLLDLRELSFGDDELDRELIACARRARLTASLICVIGTEVGEPEARARRLDRVRRRLSDPFLIALARPTTDDSPRPIIRREVQETDAHERLEVWAQLVDANRERMGIEWSTDPAPTLERLADDLRLGSRAFGRVCLEAEASFAAGEDDAEDAPARTLDGPAFVDALRIGCARHVRARLDPLIDRVHVGSRTGVALPPEEALQLDELERSIRYAPQVAQDWGVGNPRETGTVALFAGPSGTGKTHTALALAVRLGLDLYRVDVAEVLSKYIGETEQNLDRIFRAAAIGGVLLLFDEADALFGKRSEVRDSHDRYANLGTAYLLTRIEHSPTPIVLTSNLKDSIDPAFMRRMHFVIDFPFPGTAQREEIWRTIYPQQTPVHGLEPARLAGIAATGGTISNIARRGAMLAAAADSEIEMEHLLEATRGELRKAGRDLTPEELEIWR